jgi:thiopurine S-methyltransferase
MIFLRNEGANVTGVEVSVKAIKSFFKENELDFETESFAGFTIYQAEGIAIWQGDFLKFPESKFNFDLIYDKAALVALPPEKRRSYAEKLLNLSTPETKLLLHHFIYPQDEMTGPPFSVGESEIEEYFGVHFTSDLLEENIIPPEHFTPFYRRGLRSAITERFLHFNSR